MGTRRPWIFRCDGGPAIGLGHVYRCLALMEALSEQGASVAFATQFPHEIPENNPFPVHPLDIRAGRTDAALEVAQLARSLNAQGLVFDNYSIDKEFVHTVRANIPHDVKLVFIGNAPPSTSALNLVIRQTIVEPQKEKPGELVGPRFALLRKAFRDRPKRSVAVVPRRLLVTLGGGQSPYLRTVLLALNRTLGPDSYELLVTGRNLDLSWIEDPVHKLVPLGLVSDMVGLLESVDLAITACGTTLFQLAACGLPAVGVTVADSQFQQAVDFSKAGLIHFLGRADSIRENDLFRSVFDLLHDRDARERMSARGQCLVDGNGAIRCASRMISLVHKG